MQLTVPEISSPPPPVTPQQTHELMSILSSPKNFLDSLYQIVHSPYGILIAIAILILGPICLIHGWKLFKTVVIVNAGLLGVLGGRLLGESLGGQNMTLFCAIGGGVLLAILAWPLMKFGVSVMGGLAGAFLGWGIWIYVGRALGHQDPAANAWVGALLGLVTLGLLAFLIFRLVIITFTSLQGAIMTVAGILMVLMLLNASASIEHAITDDIHMLPLMILIPSVIGFAFQMTAARKKGAPAKKPDAPK